MEWQIANIVYLPGCDAEEEEQRQLETVSVDQTPDEDFGKHCGEAPNREDITIMLVLFPG